LYVYTVYVSVSIRRFTPSTGAVLVRLADE